MTREAFVYTERVEPRACPTCHTVLDGATGVALSAADQTPMAPGDLTRCAYCDSVLVVTATGFRLATDADIDGLDPRLRRVLLGVR